MNKIEKNIYLIKEKINKARKIYQRKNSEINLVAVSKMVEEERILQAINAGCRIFGENYIKEAKEKWPKIKENFPETKLHFIGGLQSNKAKDAVKLFDCIQSLDNENLALAINKEAGKLSKKIDCFIQVNIGHEKQKSGLSPLKVKEFLDFCLKLENIKIVGLMTIPPANKAASPYFALLAKIAKENKLDSLSMGMSADFEQAIALNSNYIRLGTAIFGARDVELNII